MSKTPSHNHAFYGGRSARSNEVHRLAETTFADLVRSVYFRPIPLSMTKSDFLAMPKEGRDAAKNGPYVTAASFDVDFPTRKRDHAETIELIFIDLDEDANTAALAREIASVPHTATAALHPFNCVVHHTANSTLEAPRLRIIVEAASLPLDAHRAAVALVTKRLGLPKEFKGAVESNNCVLPMFRPVIFIGEEDSPVIAHTVTGRAVTMDDLVESGEESMSLFDAEENFAADFSSELICDLEQLPVAGMTVEMIRPAVMKLDPDMDYKPWLEVAAALCHQFRDEDQARQAFDLFDEWSSGGSKYKGRKDTIFKWKSFRPDAGARKSITIRTIIKRAKENGWDSSTMYTPLKLSFQEWLKSVEVDQAMQEGCKRILATPEISSLQESEYLKDLHIHLRSAGKRIGEADLRKEIARLRAVERKERADEGTTEPWLQPYIFLAPEDKFVHIRNGMSQALTPQAFDRMFGIKMLEIESGGEGGDGGIPVNGEPKTRASVHAMNIRNIQRVVGTMYAPDKDDAVVTDDDGSMKLNTYRRHLIPALDHDAERVHKVADIWMNHLLVVTGDPAIANLLHYFVAALVQYPGRKIRWAPLIQSAQGVGKTLLGEIISSVIASCNVSIVEQSAIASGQWNEWAKDVQLAIFEEIKVHGKARMEVMNRLKTVITNDYIQIVQKFKDSNKARNVANVIAFTNFKDAVFLEETDRRYMIIWSPLQTSAQVKALRETGHFDKVVKLLKHGGALRKHLLDVTIPDDFPWNGPAPETEFTRQVIEEGKNKLLREIEDMIANPAETLVQSDVIDLGYLDNETYSLSKDNHPARHWLQHLGYQSYCRTEIHGRRTEVWWRPDVFDISECLTPDEVLVLRHAERGDASI